MTAILRRSRSSSADAQREWKQKFRHSLPHEALTASSVSSPVCHSVPLLPEPLSAFASVETPPSRRRSWQKSLLRRLSGFFRSSSPPLGTAEPKGVIPPLWLPLIQFLCHSIEQNGAHKVGIFRLSGSARTVREVLGGCAELAKKGGDQESIGRLFSWFADDEVDLKASVLKTYLCEQKHPLVPFAAHDSFLETIKAESEGEQVEQLRQHVANQIPEDNRAILECLMRSLHVIHANREENKMDASNLAIVFTPCLLRTEDEVCSILKIREECQVVENLIIHYASIFTPMIEKNSSGQHHDDEHKTEPDEMSSAEAENGNQSQDYEKAKEEKHKEEKEEETDTRAGR